MKPDTTYNGWKNHETWLVCLWIDNEEGEYLTVLDLAREALDYDPTERATMLADWFSDPVEGPARIRSSQAHYLGKAIRAHIEEDHAAGIAGFVADLVNAALDSVDWDEVADHYFDTIDEERKAVAQ